MKKRKDTSYSKKWEEAINRKPLLNLSLKGWLLLQSIFIVIGSICAYALTDYGYNTFFLKNPDYEPVTAVGMFIPMSLLVGLLLYAFSKAIYHYINELLDAITKVSRGDFSVTLDETKGGPLTDIYRKFNIMSRELSGLDAMRNDFINEFSHEFKTPLSSIHGFSELLLEGNCSPDESKKYLSIIASESERLVSITQNQLLLSKLDSQQIVTDQKDYLLDEQIRQCIIILSSEWSKKNLAFSIELDNLPFYGNADMLQHVWLNLLSNAIKYTPAGGEISVASTLTADAVQIAISDTGMGMTEDEISHIFTKYYRTENVGSIKGLGLGLPIVKRVVEMMNGRIDVKSSLGVGSTFTVILPR